MTSLLQQFREQFPTIACAIDGTDYELRFDEDGARVGVGPAVLVTVKREGRGFCLTWLVDRGILNGCGARSYSAHLSDGTRNSEFLKEFRRRLALANPATLNEVIDSAGGWSWRKRSHLKRRLAAEAF